MIVFDKEAFEKIVLDLNGKYDEEELHIIILSYIVYSNENEVNELSEYSDQLSRL